MNFAQASLPHSFQNFTKPQLIKTLHNFVQHWRKQKKAPDKGKDPAYQELFKKVQALGFFSKDGEFSVYNFRFVGAPDITFSDLTLRYFSPAVQSIRYRFNDKGLMQIAYIKESKYLKLVFFKTDLAIKRKTDPETFVTPLKELNTIQENFCKANNPAFIKTLTKYAKTWSQNDDNVFYNEKDYKYLTFYRELKSKGFLPEWQSYNNKDFYTSYNFHSEINGKPKLRIKIGHEEYTYRFHIKPNLVAMVASSRQCQK